MKQKLVKQYIFAFVLFFFLLRCMCVYVYKWWHWDTLRADHEYQVHARA